MTPAQLFLLLASSTRPDVKKEWAHGFWIGSYVGFTSGILVTICLLFYLFVEAGKIEARLIPVWIPLILFLLLMGLIGLLVYGAYHYGRLAK